MLFNTINELKEVITDESRINVVVEISFQNILWNNDGMEYINDVICDEIMGDNGYLLMDLRYKMVGCNTSNDKILIEVDADASMVLEEL